MDLIREFIQNQLSNNPFFTGGSVLMLTGAVLAFCREVPGRVLAWLKQRCFVVIDIPDREPAFEWIDQWLAHHPYSRNRARSLTVKTVSVDYRERQNDPTLDTRPKILLSPAPGEHVFLYRGRLVFLSRERPKPTDLKDKSVSIRETFTFSILGRDRGSVMQLLLDARDAAVPPDGHRINIHRVEYSSWTLLASRTPRGPESVFLREGLMESLIGDVRQFLDRKAWYAERGIPYRRGYLLYGPPGTGKSSTVMAVASTLKMEIAVLSLACSSLSDEELSELLSEFPVNSIVLIEDIDCVFVQRQGAVEKTHRLTFSGLLNALDGICAGEGRILFATTNHLERLDPALIRPGRIDRRVHIGPASRDQLSRIYRNFYPQTDPLMAVNFAENLPEYQIPLSAVQTYLLARCDSPDDAINDLEELTRSNSTAASGAIRSELDVGHPLSFSI